MKERGGGGERIEQAFAKIVAQRKGHDACEMRIPTGGKWFHPKRPNNQPRIGENTDTRRENEKARLQTGMKKKDAKYQRSQLSKKCE